MVAARHTTDSVKPATPSRPCKSIIFRKSTRHIEPRMMTARAGGPHEGTELGQSAAVRTARSGSLRAGRGSCTHLRSAGGYLEGHQSSPRPRLSVRGASFRPTRDRTRRGYPKSRRTLFRRRTRRRAQGGSPGNGILPQRSQGRRQRQSRSDRSDRRRSLDCTQQSLRAARPSCFRIFERPRCVDEAEGARFGAEARCEARPSDKGARLTADPTSPTPTRYPRQRGLA
jgi:hypothetical protein